MVAEENRGNSAKVFVSFPMIGDIWFGWTVVDTESYPKGPTFTPPALIS
jgi:hypothetical protein